ncbi:MAG: 4Fe-4S single cluster domain-containing protein [Oscillospiraceae bacterium]|nr:4Fe-4S single cluster domain-containing protein [Oscillospiraceae bacterium]
MSIIYYHMKEPAVDVLGPGRRFVLWVQGCHKNCPGCVAGGTHRMEDGKPVQTDALAWEIALSGAEGLTISGGEPFLQAPALAQLLQAVHRIRPMGVIVYTGYRYEELLAMPQAAGLLAQTDLLIDGEYIQSLDDHRGLRGSSNQRVIPLSDVYREIARQYADIPRRQQVFYHGAEIHEVGLPDEHGAYPEQEKRSVTK